MGKWPGVMIAALAMGAFIGVLFHHVYPAVRMSPELSLLFALGGLVLALLMRAGWHALPQRRHRSW